MGVLDPRAVPDMLVGMAPAPSGACPRCGRATRALANGRGRLDICSSCGTMDLASPEGLDVWSLRGTPVAPVPPVARLRRPDETLRLR